jgi:threonine dehydratase
VIHYGDIEAARERIRPYVRRTPLMQVTALKDKPFAGQLSLKLESLQVSGSFKARGAVSKLLTLPEETLARGLVTASGGNHGVAVAYAGWLSNHPATVFLPNGTPQTKIDKLRQWGARVMMEGAVWDEANAAALLLAEREGMAYLHPFADAAVIAGQGTLAPEILEDDPAVDTLLVAIGGGGLIGGVGLGIKTLKPAARIIGVEPTGAPTLKRSVEAGEVVQLPEITTKAGTLAPRRSAQVNLDLVRDHVDDIVLVSDAEMADAAHWLWFETGIAAELSGAAALAALLCGRVQTEPGERVCVLVCGAGADGISP